MTNSNVGTTEDMIVEGYAILFNTLSDDLGGFKEIIAPNALNGVDISDVKCLINHDFSYVIGRTQAGTLELKVDEKGLYFKCFLPNTSYARDIYENIKAGNVSQCSFFYTLPPDDDNAISWSNSNGTYIQTVNKIDQLIEVSIVTVPAYKETSVAVGQRAVQIEEVKELQAIRIQLELDDLAINGF